MIARARLFEIVEHPLAEPEQRRAGRRNPNLAPQPQKQLLVELLFEQQDLAADGGLREVELLAGARERAGLRDRPQNLELSKIHACALPARRQATPGN